MNFVLISPLKKFQGILKLCSHLYLVDLNSKLVNSVLKHYKWFLVPQPHFLEVETSYCSGNFRRRLQDLQTRTQLSWKIAFRSPQLEWLYGADHNFNLVIVWYRCQANWSQHQAPQSLNIFVRPTLQALRRLLSCQKQSFPLCTFHRTKS